MNSKGIEPHTLSLTPQLVRSVKYALIKYQEYLESLEESCKKNKKSEEMLCVDNELKAVKEQCNNLKDTIKSLD